MHPPHIKKAALELINAGHNDCEIARRLVIPRTTIRDWRQPKYSAQELSETCHRCWLRTRPMRFTPEDYSEFVGLYLGDGCISAYGRTFRFRLTLDKQYPGIISDACGLLMRCLPANRVDVVNRAEGCVDVSVYSSHLPCLLPQHGPGPKHSRHIALEPWQAEMLDRCPWPFIRGCIRTDGCSFINRTGRYEYLSYDFTNRSDDITQLFIDACERVGVRPRASRSHAGGVWRVRINRRACVTLMEEHVGLKR
jgi:hypothetical protein